jgi:hypothetical protein
MFGQSELNNFLDNIALILMWVGAWAILDLMVAKYFKKNILLAYFILFVIGTLLVFIL